MPSACERQGTLINSCCCVGSGSIGPLIGVLLFFTRCHEVSRGKEPSLMTFIAWIGFCWASNGPSLGFTGFFEKGALARGRNWVLGGFYCVGSGSTRLLPSFLLGFEREREPSSGDRACVRSGSDGASNQLLLGFTVFFQYFPGEATPEGALAS